MMHEPQPHPSTPASQDRDIGESCTACGADSIADSMDGGVNCARCGQWQVLCDDCMPLTEYARDAVWCCPECQERPLDS